MDEEVATILFRRYKSDDGGPANGLLDTNREHRQSLRPNMPMPPLHLDDAEKRWLLYSNKCNLKELKKLIEIDDELINKKCFFTGFAAVHWAVKKERLDVIKWLSGQNADMNMRTNGGYTPLHIATIHNKTELVEKLIKDFKVDINIRDYSGRKARHYVQTLISHELPTNVHKALKETRSILELKVDPNVLLAEHMMPHRAYSLPNSNSLPNIAEQSSPTSGSSKKKKKSNSFKGKKKVQIMKRFRSEGSPATERKLRWRKCLSVPDVSMMISAPSMVDVSNDVAPSIPDDSHNGTPSIPDVSDDVTPSVTNSCGEEYQSSNLVSPVSFQLSKK